MLIQQFRNISNLILSRKPMYLLMLVSVLFMGACNNESGEKDHNKTELNKEQSENDHQHEGEQEKVLLDNGKKWKANAETISGISNMTALVQNGIMGKMEGVMLHDTLQIAFKTIFDKCTMTGESHNQLHNFLLPLKGQLDKLKTGSSEMEILEEMLEHLSTFKNYFE